MCNPAESSNFGILANPASEEKRNEVTNVKEWCKVDGASDRQMKKDTVGGRIWEGVTQVRLPAS